MPIGRRNPKPEPEWYAVMKVPQTESRIVLTWLGQEFEATFHSAFQPWGTAWYVSIPSLQKVRSLVKTNQISRWRYHF